MIEFESNILEVAAEFADWLDEFDFTIPGVESSLGKDIAVEVARGIQERTLVDQKDATGESLKALNPKYKARKLKTHGVDAIGILTGQMLGVTSLLGKVTITPDEVTMEYGIGLPPTRSSTSGELKADEPTDRQKAEWFTEGGRPFYELDDAIGEKVHAVVADALDRHEEKFRG